MNTDLTRLLILLSLLLSCTILLNAQSESKGSYPTFTNLEQALVESKKTNKDIFVNFTGSDWCHYCIQLRKEVLTQKEWQDIAPTKYVFLTLDFPDQIPQTEEVQAYNEKLKNLFVIDGFPTVFLLTPEGIPYARTGYVPGGPKAYLKHLEEFRERKVEISHMKEILSAKDNDQKKADITELINKLDRWLLLENNTAVVEEYIKLNPEKDSKRIFKYAMFLRGIFRDQLNIEKYNQYEALAMKLDKLSFDTFQAIEHIEQTLLFEEKNEEALKALYALLETHPTGEAGQMLYYLISAIHFQTNQKEKCIPLLTKAYDMAPQSRLAEEIRYSLDMMKDAESVKKGKE